MVLDTWNAIRPGGGWWVRDDKIWMKVLDPLKYDQYKDLDGKSLASKLRTYMTEELLEIRDRRRETEQKY